MVLELLPPLVVTAGVDTTGVEAAGAVTAGVEAAGVVTAGVEAAGVVVVGRVVGVAVVAVVLGLGDDPPPPQAERAKELMHAEAITVAREA